MAAPAQEAADPRASLPRDAVVLEIPWIAGGPTAAAPAAMALRYWGFEGIGSGDVVAGAGRAAGDSGGGPDVYSVARFVREVGWDAHVLAGRTGDFDEALRHLGLGRPVVVGLDGRYVLVVGIADGAGSRVVVHDPAAGPYQVLPAERFDPEGASGSPGPPLLILPPRRQTNVRPFGDGAPEGVVDPTSRPEAAAVPDSCRANFEAGLAAAGAGGLAEAAGHFRADGCAAVPAVALELAGVLLRAGRAHEALAPAELAARELPQHAHAWRTLATVHYLRGDRERALDAWNRADEPVLDLVYVQHTGSTPRARLVDRLGLRTGTRLTRTNLGLARRRLEDTPSIAISRVDYEVSGPGRADVDAVAVERPRLPTGSVGLATIAVRAALYRQVSIESAAPLGRGEAWRLDWRWWENRPAVGLRVDAPDFGVGSSVTTFAVRTEAESYGAFVETLVDAPPERTERTGGMVELAGWWTPVVRAGVRLGIDGWQGGGARLRTGGRLAWRLEGDHLRTEVEFDRWTSDGEEPGFDRLSVGTRYELDFGPRLAAGLRGTFQRAGEGAPLTLWPGAGTGIARPDLLRAHPLLDDGRISGVAFDRHLVGGGVEATRWVGTAGVARAGVAVFVDAARTWGERSAETRVDAGLGLRLGSVSGAVFRIDAAWGLSDDERAISAGGSLGVP